MLYLSAGTNSNKILTLSEKATLANPVYVLVFVNDNTGYKTACVITDVSADTTREQEFTVSVQASPNWLSGQVNLDSYGFHHYYAYECEDASIINYTSLIDADLRYYVPTYFTTLVETGKMKYLTADETYAYYADLKTTMNTYGK